MRTEFLCECLAVMALSAAAFGAPGDPRLVDAAKNKDNEAVHSLVKQHADVNLAEPDGSTALQWAAHWDDQEMADELIRAGANVNAANEYGVTPLWLACSNGSAAMVEKLAKAGANPNAALAEGGATALMMCARTGNAETVKILLGQGGNANARETRRGQTALMWAVEEDHLDAARALLEKSADVHARSKSGFTPLMSAARVGDVELARTLIAAGSDVNDSTPDDGSALVVASASGREALGIFLLEKGANPNAADGLGFSALHYAVQKGLSDISAVEYTSSVAPPPDLTELAKALLAHGANPNARIAKDYPPHSRAPFRQTGPISITGATPFFLAAAAGDAALMRILKAGGADPLLATKANITPLMVAAGMGRVQDFFPAEEARALEAVQLAVELGADVNASAANGQTALHAAAFTGVDAMVKFLVEKGANVHARDKVGQTAWSIAEAMSPVVNNQGALRLHQTTADLLLQLGATTISASEFQPPREAGSIRQYGQGDAQNGKVAGQ